jgi:hypothetical protein
MSPYLPCSGGDGTFLPATTYRDDNLGEVYYAAAGDLNADGKTDVAAAEIGDAVWVLIGRGDGTLNTAVDYRAGDTPSGVAVGDLNGDRRLDLAVSSINSSDVSVLLGRGDGTFGNATDHRLAEPFSGTVGAVLADLNRDGNLDIVMAVNSFPGNVGLALGRGDGSFARTAHYRVGRNANAVAVADLNGDALPDLTVAHRFFGDASRRRDVAVLLQTTATPPRIDVSGLRRRGCLKRAARISIQVTSATSVQSVSVFVDRARIAHTTRRHFSVTVHAQRLRPGRHSFHVIATNRARLRATERLRFRRCR